MIRRPSAFTLDAEILQFVVAIRHSNPLLLIFFFAFVCGR